MKKRIIATLLVLAMVICMSAQLVTAAEPTTYDVGYAKVDINPYADSSGEDQTLFGLPMGGYASVTGRKSVGKIDDNGDGVIDENDGLFATCIAVTDQSGKTALLFNVDSLSAYGEYVNRVRNILLSDEAFKGYDLATDRILFNGSHTHSSPAMNSSYSSYADFGEAYKEYRTFFVNQLVSAAKAALADQAPATMYKGTIDASESEAAKSDIGETLNEIREDAVAAGEAESVEVLSGESYLGRTYNGVRHYKITEKEQEKVTIIGDLSYYKDTGNTVTYVAGNGFNGDYRGVDSSRTTEDESKKYIVTEAAHVSEADDQMNILEFRFDEACNKDSIALINWRCHLPGTTGSAIASDAYYRVSSSMVNSLRYTLEKNGYRAAYFQGAAGNVNSTSFLTEGAWMRSSETGHEANVHNIYGTELAEVALELLKSDSMTQINENGGEIKSLYQHHQTEREEVSAFEYMAGLQYQVAYAASGSSSTGSNITYRDLYYYVDAEGNPMIDTATGLPIDDTTGTLAKVEADTPVVITSIFHANHEVDAYPLNGTAGNVIDLYALTIGDGFKLVGISGEPFDRYSDDGSLTENKWDEVGADFVMGYTNSGSGYIASKATFSFSEGCEEYGYAQGSYESVRHPFVAGVGEEMLDQCVLMLDFLQDGTTSATTDTTCAHCDKSVTWTKLTQEEMQSGELSLTQIIRSGHYILDEDITWDDMETMIGADVCLNLNGKTLTVKKAIDVKSYSTLSILGDGIVDGYEAKQYGGVFAVDNYATLNQYGGTFRYSGETTVWTSDDSSPATKYDGGIIFVDGVFNMYGGTVEGSQVNWVGGAIYVDTDGIANFRGGTVTEYTGDRPSYIGDCVANLGVVTFGDDANIAEVYMDYRPDGSPDLGESLVFDGTFTGYVNIHVKAAQRDVDIGNAVNNANFSQADIYVNGAHTYAPQIIGSDIYITEATDYAVTDAETGTVTFGNNFNDLVADVAAGSSVVAQWDTTDDITVSKNLNLDLNGHVLGGSVTVDEGVTLSVTDSATADFDISDGKYGKITLSADSKGTVEGKPATDDNDAFLKVDEGDGYVSFHAVDVNINTMSLKPENQGIYYKHQFVSDIKVSEQVVAYGVALSIAGEPTEEDLVATTDLEAEECVVKGDGVVLTRFTGNFGSDAGTSTLVTGIMKETAGYTTNNRNSSKPIYGRAYVRLADGSYILGVTRNLSLKDLVQNFDGQWEKLNSQAQNRLVQMYKNSTYNKVMRNWTVPNLKNPTQTDAEKDTLRILAVGNSHTVDCTSMLSEIFKAEMPEQKVMVGALYKSGCKVSEHVSYAANNSASYTYYKNEDGTWTPSLNKTTGTDTFRDGVQDQQWDVVVLHEMNTTGISESTYNNSNLQTHINNIKSNSITQPKLLWNLSWANPTGETFLAQGDEVYSKWSSNYATNSNTDYTTMFSQLANNANTYVMTNQNISGMLPTGTAICYARNVLGQTDSDLYRDYTHMSDLGRLISGYVWYATITGQESISEVNIDYVPKTLCQQNTSAGFTVTEEMKQIIIASVNFALVNPSTASPVSE